MGLKGKTFPLGRGETGREAVAKVNRCKCFRSFIFFFNKKRIRDQMFFDAL